MEQKVVLKMKGISKFYPGVVALDKVDLEVREGEVHALLGENGAGKSTLIKVLSGAVHNEEGTIWINGKEFNHMTPAESRANGVEVIYQEYNLIPALSAAENICLGNQMHGIVNMKEQIRTAQELFDKYHINVNPRAPVASLPTAKQQLVEITKAISKNPKIIVMDEPTAQLTVAEVENLYQIIKNLKEKGTAIIFISHRMDELFAVTDRVTIMRDGQYVTTVNTAETNRDALIALMVGRELKSNGPRQSVATDEVVLEVEDISGYSNDRCSFKLHKGEILGFAGLVGAGRTELMRLVFGADKKLSGTVKIRGQEVNIRSPQDAIRAGIGLIPEDRKQQGVFLNQAISWNNAIGNIRGVTTGGLIDEKKILKQAEEYKDRLKIKAPSVAQLVRNLSGGNQQKVVLAKVLAAETDIVIFDEPTRGIDVGARAEIYELMNELVNEGKSILMVSSDMEELLGMCDRIIVLAEGKITGEFTRPEFDQEKIMSKASVD
ncbi:MAG: sugar ABC transporter ATP-binding protein [Oscillospiraceae bacterium]|nr:sugar ABC transporter ATP-binding protein [Oscillospiraceae bacterium]